MRKNLFKNIDVSLFLIYLALVFFGVLNIYSTAFDGEYPAIYSFNKAYGKQFVFALISLFFGLFIILLDINFIRKSAYGGYVFTLLLLLLVLVAGKSINGARSWFVFGGVSIQPSEFAKYTTALALARYLSTINVRLQAFSTKLRVFILISVPAFLILLQPDAGTVLVFLSFILVLYREGLSGNLLLYGLLSIIIAMISIRFSNEHLNVFSIELKGIYFLSILIAIIFLFSYLIIKKLVLPRYQKKQVSSLLFIGIMSITILWSSSIAFNKLPSHHQDRIGILLGLKDLADKEVRQGKGYNLYQALAAIGSGGFSGKGYKEATLANSKFRHVPEQSTDFVFTTIAEEWGTIGGLVLFGLFISLFIKIIIIAERQRSTFTRVYAYSVASILFFHFTINLGMAMGLAPVIGIPLPFFSKGGSSLLIFSILIFTLLKLDSDRMEVFR